MIPLKPLVYLLVASLVVLFIFFKYGSSIYMPMVHNVNKKETVASMIEKIGPDVRERLAPKLHAAGYNEYPVEILLAAFKSEQVLQVFAKNHKGFKLITSYPFTAFSGQLGPKLQEGDKQIPEGIYKIEYLNPNSAFYLSIKVSYPNEFDISKSRLANQQDMGGDIFIHGKSATVGCIPIGDEAIEEVFLLVQKAFQNEVKVIVSPKDFRRDTSYPQIESVDWEVELYDQIKVELEKLPD